MAGPTESRHGMWSNRWLFVLAAAGSAVGLGNIWKFPYIAGENGGGAFVILYLLCIAFIGIPIMMAEVLIGREGRQSPINTMRHLIKQHHRNSVFLCVGERDRMSVARKIFSSRKEERINPREWLLMTWIKKYRLVKNRRAKQSLI